MTAVATLAPTCEARVGFYPGEYGESPLWCSARIGLTVWEDSRGQTHRACRHHVDGLQHRYPEQTPARAALDVGIAVFDRNDPCPRCGRGGPPHNASPRCESGGRTHCSCEVCF